MPRGLPFNKLPAGQGYDTGMKILGQRPLTDGRLNELPASGPMAQQAEREFRNEMNAAGQEFTIELQALQEQLLSDKEYNNKVARLHGKHSVQALRMRRGWNQRMAMIQQYEELGAAGTMAPERARQEQYELSGYDVPTQQKPDIWSEHRDLVQQRNRITDMLINSWAKKRGKWRSIEEIDSGGKVTKYGDKATPAELQQIEAMQDMISQFDQYEFSLLQQMDPQHRKINQLSRAMAMGPRVLATPGVGGKRTRIPLGEDVREAIRQIGSGGYAPNGRKPERERFETPGYKMTREKAVTQARTQLGPQADKERILILAKEIFSSSQQPRSAQ